ncbi:MAG TPA: hypothetical protein VIM07_04675 [Chitinophagaceae bacterium]
MLVFYKLLLLLIILSCISACGKCPCVDSNIDPAFIGFNPSEVDTIIIRKYSKNNNFNTLIDTAFFDNKTSFQIQKSNDTISFPYRPGNFSIDKNYDWVLFLPSINRTFKISNIVSPQVSLPCPNKVQCVNPINSLNIDGVVSVPAYFTFYLKK